MSRFRAISFSVYFCFELLHGGSRGFIGWKLMVYQGHLTVCVYFTDAAGVAQALEGAERAGPFVAADYAPFDTTTVLDGEILSGFSVAQV